MKKKYITILKQFCAVVTAMCFTFTVVADNLYASVNFDTVKAQKQYFEEKEKNDLNSFFPDRYGKVVSYSNNLSNTVVINIQDLHCDYSVQKNIAAIIEEISKKYNVEDVYVEGGIGAIDTSFFANINPQYKRDILERLLKDGRLTGTEYYSAISDKTKLLKGVEEKDVYLKNIVRLNDILNLKNERSVYLANIEREIDFLKSKYLKSKNKQFDKLVKQAENKKISQEQFIMGLFNYAKQNNISLKNYENLKIYLNLFDSSVKNKKVQKELVEVLGVIKNSLPYDEYNKFVKSTSNFNDIQKISSFVKDFCDVNNINLSKTYPNLNEFFILKEQSVKCNPIELVKEERKLIDVIRTYLSENETELEIAYLSDFEQFYNGYLSASLTAAQWEYVKLGLDKFKELYAKYSVSNDVEKLGNYSELLTQFYDANTERNTIFVRKMGLSDNSSSNRPIIQSSDLLASAKKIVILVAGGYHTDGINEILNKKGISNITVTPNVARLTKDSRAQYEYLAQQQAMSVRQMIALGLISNSTTREQILTVVNSLLLNQNLDGVNINILVQQLNQIFSQNITVSLVQDGKRLEFDFKDGSKQVIDIDEDVASVVEEQNKRNLSEGQFVRVTGDKLKDIMGLVSKTTFNYGTEIFAPQVYQISKDICLFMVENKWYLGNGAVWEIANSEYDGKTLDGVEPIVYEYMPDFMQKTMLSKQQSSDMRRKFSLKPLIKRITSAILAVALAISLTACSVKKQEPVDYRYSPQIEYTVEQDTEIRDEFLMELQEFESGSGVYNSFVYSSMSAENARLLTKKEINIISNQQNLYDQALVALMFIQQAQIAKESGDLDRADIMLENAASILAAIDSHDVLYKSNLEQIIVTGEILWVGIAATQYKLVSEGSTQFDALIAKVDKHIDMFYRNAGFIYGRADENWVSTEHILDAIGYYNLKLYCDEKYGSSVDFNVQNRLYALSSYLYKELYDKDNKTFYRGRYDKYHVLDTCSWGVQVLAMVEYMNPELFEYGLNGESYLKSIDIYALLDYAENHFSTTVEYNGNIYTNLYTAAEEDGNPVMFEWTLQMAVSYLIAANKSEIEGNFLKAEEYRQKAQNIIKDVQDYSRDLNFDYPPYIDQNGRKIYQKNGWIAYQVEFVAGLAQMQQFYFGSFYFPIDDTERQIEIPVPSSILPVTLNKLNNMISKGAFSMKKGLLVILKTETVRSLLRPFNFIKSHFQTGGAKILIFVTTVMLLLSFGAFSAFIPLISAILSSIAIALGTNIGTHVIMDYRYFKSIGLEEAVSLYGKDNVRLTERGLLIKNGEQSVPIYVINEEPTNARDFNFKPVPIRIKAQNGKTVKCWVGNYNGLTVLFAEGADYDSIVKEFNKTRQFNSVYGRRTTLKTNVDVIEVDMNNPDSGLRYSDTGNIIVGSNVVETGGVIDLQKEISLLNNKKVEAVTINQNIAIYIDDAPDTLSVSEDFVEVINYYINSETLGVNAKILFSNEYIGRVLELLKQELGDEKLAKEKFIKIIKNLKDENKEVVVIFEDSSKVGEAKKYQEYGIFSYMTGNKFVDGITSTETEAKFVTNLSQISCFDGSLSVIKVSLFRDEIEKSSGVFTFLSSTLNLKEYMRNRSIKFIKQVASNFDYNQIPKLDIDTIAKMLKSETKFEDLRQYLSETDSVLLYYSGLSGEEEKTVFMDAILNRILVVNYLRKIDNDKDSFGLKNKKMEEILAAALVAKYNKDNNFDILSQETLNENMKTAQFEIEFEKMIMDKVSTGFKNGLSEINDPQSIDDIIKLIPLYAERNVQLRTANVKVMDIQNIKGILSAA